VAALADALALRLETEMKNMGDLLIVGQVTDWANYRERVGYLAGIRRAHALLMELAAPAPAPETKRDLHG
jgi:hypothetical protein